MTAITTNLTRLRAELPQGISLVAVSKFHSADAIREAYDCGQRIFGESHEQELKSKHAQLPADIEWHFIGHLQTNKVKGIAPYISMIHSVDSLRLLAEIDRQAEKAGRTIDVLLELRIAQEATKYGLAPDECRQLLCGGEWRDMHHVRICGLMAMASLTDDTAQLKREFTTAADFFDEVKNDFFKDDPAFCQRSWGMSDDYPIAISCRSTMVRVGTAIFGPREY